MNLKQCNQGHFYDSDMFFRCPYCGDPGEAIALKLPGRFELYKITGGGNNGRKGEKVYYVEEKISKALNVIECNSDTARSHIEKEIRIMKDLKGCANIVEYFDSEIQEKKGGAKVFVLTERVMPLDSYLSKHGDVTDILDLVIKVCNALTQCHQKGILHLNVSPGNCFVDSRDNIKLGNFAYATYVDEPFPSYRRRIRRYMAPELCIGEKCDVTADIYSVGMILVFFFGDVSDSISASGEETAFLNLYPKLATIIYKATDHSPAKRYQSAEDMAEDLVEFRKEFRNAQDIFEEHMKKWRYIMPPYPMPLTHDVVDDNMTVSMNDGPTTQLIDGQDLQAECSEEDEFAESSDIWDF